MNMQKKIIYSFFLIVLVVFTLFNIETTKAGTDLVAHWGFDEGQGEVLHDMVGKADGIISGATWVPGYYGTALMFDGVDDYVEITNMPGLETFTFMFRVKANLPIIEGRITSVTFDRFDTQINSNGNLMLQIKDYGWLETGLHIDSDSWTFVAITFDGTKVKIYKNATLVKTIEATGFLPGNYMRFGSRFKDYKREGTFSNISLDEVQIMPYPLNSTSIIHSYTYNLTACDKDFWECENWNKCTPDGIQTRECNQIFDCDTTNDKLPETTQSCIYEAPVCADWNYSDWSDCTPEGKQSRNVIESIPNYCEGGNPILSQSCSYTAPTPQISGTEVNYTGDLNLTLDNNPYIVRQDLIIYPGQTIKIQKGVNLFFDQDTGVCFQNGECLKYGWPGVVPDIAGRKLIFTSDVYIMIGSEPGQADYKIVSHNISGGTRYEGERGIILGSRGVPLNIENYLDTNIAFLVHGDWFGTFYDTGTFDEYWSWDMWLYFDKSTHTNKDNPIHDFNNADEQTTEDKQYQNQPNEDNTKKQAPTTTKINKEEKTIGSIIKKLIGIQTTEDPPQQVPNNQTEKQTSNIITEDIKKENTQLDIADSDEEKPLINTPDNLIENIQPKLEEVQTQEQSQIKNNFVVRTINSIKNWFSKLFR